MIGGLGRLCILCPRLLHDEIYLYNFMFLSYVLWLLAPVWMSRVYMFWVLPVHCEKNRREEDKRVFSQQLHNVAVRHCYQDKTKPNVCLQPPPPCQPANVVSLLSCISVMCSNFRNQNKSVSHDCHFVTDKLNFPINIFRMLVFFFFFFFLTYPWFWLYFVIEYLFVEC